MILAMVVGGCSTSPQENFQPVTEPSGAATAEVAEPVAEPVAAPTGEAAVPPVADSGPLTAAEAVVQASLVKLSAASSRLDMSLSFGDQRKAAASAMADARAGMGSARASSRRGTRSCSSVFLARNRVLAAAGRVRAAGADLARQAATARSRSRKLNSARAQLVADLKKLVSAQDGPGAIESITPEAAVREVAAAERDKVRLARAAVAEAQTRATTAVGKAERIADSAQSLAYRVC